MSDQKAYFFLGPNYIRYDTIDDAVDPNYPRALPGGWINLPFASIDAGVNWGNGQIYFFSGNRYARVTLANNNTMDAGYPLDIAGHWPGLTFATIDAAVNLGNGKVFFFLADEYVSYDIAADHVDPGFPRKIAPDWPGLFPPGIDAAVNWGNGKAYFQNSAGAMKPLRTFSPCRSSITAGIAEISPALSMSLKPWRK